MVHQALYRRYRPQRFGELVGQEHVTAALRNAVRDGRVGHAYLFSGPRGTGKTTTARILAKALNCTNLGADGEPCDECDNCRAITAGRFLDLFELDAASNNSIDDVRDLVEKVALGLSTTGRMKVYVVDEVHMLGGAGRSTPAANALLKTLEEPPAHVVFVLATTEPERVPPTIRSRTQHLEFTLVPTEKIRAHLAAVCAREGVEAATEALEVIARAGTGSVRDALSLLDQALAHGADRLEGETVAALFGGTPFVVRTRILDAIAGEDAAAALVALGELVDAGHEPRRIAEDLLRGARDGFLLVAGGGRVRIDAPDEEQERLAEIGRVLGNAALVRVLETLGQAIVDMRGVDAADPRLVLEIALVRLSRREAGPALQTVLERLERLERQRTSSGSFVQSPPSPAAGAPREALGGVRERLARARLDDAASAPDAVAPASAPDAVAPGAPEESVPAAPEPAPSPPAFDIDDVVLAWGEVLPSLPPATRASVQHAQPLRVEGEVVVFGVPPHLLSIARDRFKREADAVRAALAERLGRPMRFGLEAADDLSEPVPSVPPASPEPRVVDTEPVTAAVSSQGLLEQRLGATVVEELPRE